VKFSGSAAICDTRSGSSMNFTSDTSAGLKLTWQQQQQGSVQQDRYWVWFTVQSVHTTSQDSCSKAVLFVTPAAHSLSIHPPHRTSDILMPESSTTATATATATPPTSPWKSRSA
jgi:hypothetical protein